MAHSNQQFAGKKAKNAFKTKQKRLKSCIYEDGRGMTTLVGYSGDYEVKKENND